MSYFNLSQLCLYRRDEWIYALNASVSQTPATERWRLLLQDLTEHTRHKGDGFQPRIVSRLTVHPSVSKVLQPGVM